MLDGEGGYLDGDDIRSFDLIDGAADNDKASDIF